MYQKLIVTLFGDSNGRLLTRLGHEQPIFDFDRAPDQLISRLPMIFLDAFFMSSNIIVLAQMQIVGIHPFPSLHRRCLHNTSTAHIKQHADPMDPSQIPTDLIACKYHASDIIGHDICT